MARTPDVWTGAGWGTVTDRADGTWLDAVTRIIDTLVPLLIADFAARPRAVVIEYGAQARRVTASHGECFFFHSGAPDVVAAGGNALCVQVAAAAVLADDGCDFGGRHWCRGGCPRCRRDTAAAWAAHHQHLDALEALL